MISLLLGILLISQSLSLTDLYVGYSGKSNNFNTVQDAVNQAALINPQNENARVTIHIAPGTYRQQVVVQTPYITFINDEPSKGKAVLTWYYGIGSKYYSCSDQGYYDANLAKKKSSKNKASKRWGATVLLFSKASYFKAKDIVFENSFNNYMTTEEINDGVECTGETIQIQRTASLDVKAKSSTERAAAISIESPYSEFLNCIFYSSQDTLYTGASPIYFKSCLIEGQTDYIFGAANAVFDSCELRWKGYSTGSTGGYITAARGDTNNYKGYLMYNCKVTKNKGLTVKEGLFGRPWLQSARVLFFNTVLVDSTTIGAAGWGAMSGVQPETVDGFKEYNTKLANGASVSTSQRKGHIVSDNDAKTVNVINYLNNWTPTYM